MTTTTTTAIASACVFHTACLFPRKLSQWTGELGLARLAEESAHETWQFAAGGAGATEPTGGERLLAVLAVCYAEGIFASEDIEWAAEAKPMVSQLAGGRALAPAALQRFRRNHSQLLEACLSRLLFAAWQMRSFVPDQHRVGVEVAGDARLAEAATEARKRIQLAMQFDLAFSE